MPKTPDSTRSKRLPKIKGGRQAVMLRLSPEDHAELAANAKQQQRSLSNLAMIRYQIGCRESASL
jgi:predicted HicB family RNase H-like nuclease